MTAMLRAKLINRTAILMLFGITVLCATLGMANLQFMPTSDISFAGTPDYKFLFSSTPGGKPARRPTPLNERKKLGNGFVNAI